MLIFALTLTYVAAGLGTAALFWSTQDDAEWAGSGRDFTLSALLIGLWPVVLAPVALAAVLLLFGVDKCGEVEDE